MVTDHGPRRRSLRRQSAGLGPPLTKFVTTELIGVHLFRA